MKGIYPCPECARDTSHSILSIVNSNHFDGSGLAQFWDHYLTIRCNGCGTISFCHASRCSEDEDFDENGMPSLIQHMKHYPNVSALHDSNQEHFVDPIRIQELGSLDSGNEFDTTKLTQMLAELNRAYVGHSFLSCMLLIRSILDHIPPILGFNTFIEVANNYKGAGRSFREAMLHLENSSRKIADSYLHLHIRAKETVPTRTQVEFRADIDVLIGEIARVLRSKP